MDYDFIEIEKNGNENYVTFKKENNEEVFHSVVIFNNQEIEDDNENCFLVSEVHCDYLEELIELNENDEQDDLLDDEISDEYYKLRTETYDLGNKLILVLILLSMRKDGTKFYICGNKISMTKNIKYPLSIYEELLDYIENLMEKKYSSDEERTFKIIEGFGFVKEYFINYVEEIRKEREEKSKKKIIELKNKFSTIENINFGF